MQENMNNGSNLQSEENLSEQAAIRREKLTSLKNRNADPYEETVYNVTGYSKTIIENFETMEGTDISVAGRLMSRRDMGKANFINISDSKGSIQVYVRIDDIGEAVYNEYKTWDLGDIIGIDGKVFKTRKGEISIHATALKLLSKALNPLPEKWHGLTDTEIRYRRRYLDLIVNREVMDAFVIRSKIIKALRSFMDNQGFLEVETPVLHNIAGGAAARPFTTHHNALDMDLYLRIALELHLKRLIVGGFDKVYEIGRVFRNEGIDIRHNPEFTLFEFYQAYTDYNGMMDITEKMFRYVANQVLGKTNFMYGEIELDFGKPFEKISMVDAVKKYAGVDFSIIETLEQARDIAKKHHIVFEQRHGIGDILNMFFDEYAEKNLIQPTFLTEHPVEISPLAKRLKDDPRYTQRFELFVAGRELANAFSELNDPIDQRERFMHQAALKAQGDLEANDVDEDFLLALEYGMPPTGGEGIGVDRLVMLLTNSTSIRDILLFPTLRNK